MKHIFGIKNCAEDIAKLADTISTLRVLEENGFEYDIFNEEPLYEDDDNKVSSHIQFFEYLIEEDLKVIDELMKAP